MTDCGISTHAEDLNAVMKFFRKKFRKIFVAGHSLGGLTILLSNADLADGIVFWDSSSKPRGRLGDFNYDKKLKKYVIRWGTECLMSKRMFTEWKNFPSPKKAIAKINRPVKVIVSGRGILQKAGREYYRFAKKPKGFSIIKGASHNFDEEGVAEKLFLETLDFIKK
jgi:pimeloyl-ACP methyl ester carboxylesterase